MNTPLAALFLTAGFWSGLAAETKPADYVVHEWGTFTSLQGADGKQMEWLSQIGADLPNFVYHDSHPGSIGGGYLSRSMMRKSSRRARQRMETPVLYFYSGEPRTVDVEVKFPQGTVTEWFPRVSHAGPTMGTRNVDRIPAGRTNDSYVCWNDVEILPRDQYVTLRNDGTQSHYYPARVTDANPLRVRTGIGKERKVEHDKLLFYRGLGQFDVPLQVSLSPDEKKLRLQNTGTEKLEGLFVLVVKNGRAKVTSICEVAKARELDWNPEAGLRSLSEVVAELSSAVETALVSHGLYCKEAQAMVNTWRGSWFEEEGVRVLYVLPTDWTEKTLPLSLSPEPTQVVRVMVGRAELITPKREWALLQEIIRFSDPEQRNAAVNATRKMRIGRFFPPMIERLLGTHPTQAFRMAAQTLRATLLAEEQSYVALSPLLGTR